MDIYVKHDGECYGPMALGAVAGYLQDGTFHEEDIVTTEHDPDGWPLYLFLQQQFAIPPTETPTSPQVDEESDAIVGLFVEHEGATYGPLELEQVIDCLREGSLSSEDLIWTMNKPEPITLARFFTKNPVPVRIEADQSSQLFVEHDGENYGPLALDQVMDYLQEGRFRDEDLAWSPGSAEAQPLSSYLPAASSPPVAEIRRDGEGRARAGARSGTPRLSFGTGTIIISLGLTCVVLSTFVGYLLLARSRSAPPLPALASTPLAPRLQVIVATTPFPPPSRKDAPAMIQNPEQRVDKSSKPASTVPADGEMATSTSPPAGKVPASYEDISFQPRPPVSTTSQAPPLSHTFGATIRPISATNPFDGPGTSGSPSMPQSGQLGKATPPQPRAQPVPAEPALDKFESATGPEKSTRAEVQSSAPELALEAVSPVSSGDPKPRFHPFDPSVLTKQDLLDILSDRFAAVPVNAPQTHSQKGDPYISIREGSFTLTTHLRWNPEVKVDYSIPMHLSSSPAQTASNILMIGTRMSEASPPAYESNAYLSGSDVIQIGDLVQKVQNPSDPLSKYILGKFSQPVEFRFTDPHSTNQQRQNALIEGLDQVLGGDCLFDPDAFASIPLSAESQALMAQHPQKGTLVWLNRMLLQDCYPANIKRKPMDAHIVDIRAKSPLYRDLDAVSSETGFTTFAMEMVYKPNVADSAGECYTNGGPEWVDLVFRAQDELTRRYNLPPRGLLMYGSSLGGSFLERIAAARPDRVAALAINDAPSLILPKVHSSTAWYMGIVRGDTMYGDYDALYNKLLELNDNVDLGQFQPNFGKRDTYHVVTPITDTAAKAFLKGVVNSYDSSGNFDVTQWPYVRDRTKPLRIVENGSADGSGISQASREYLPSREFVQILQSVPARMQTLGLGPGRSVTSKCFVGLPPYGKPKAVIVYSTGIEYANIENVIDDINYLANEGYLVFVPRLSGSDSSALQCTLDFIKESPVLDELPLLCLGSGERGAPLWNIVATDEELSPKAVAFLNFDGSEEFGETNVPVGSRIRCPILFVYNEKDMIDVSNSEGALASMEKLHGIDLFLQKCKERHQPARVMFVPKEIGWAGGVAQASVNFVNDIFGKLLVGRDSVMNAQ